MSREMKDSGIRWLGSIPDDWKIIKVKDGFIQKKAKAYKKDPVILSLARDGVKIRDISTNEGQIASSYYEYNPVEPMDMLLNPMDLQSGANCSLSKVSGVISPAYVNLRYKPGFDPRFYDYYFKYQYWSFAFFAHGKGVSFDNRWTLNNETLMNYPLIAPSYDEQHRIADFLDRKCSQIDEISKKIQEEIETLEEYKRSVITEAVTKGLDPNAEMKDSRIPWISGIPQTWQQLPIRYLFDEVRKKNSLGKEKKALKFTYGTIIPKTNFDADEEEYVANTILNYTIVDPGVIMINCLNLNFDFVSQRIGLVNDKGVITSAYLAIKSKDENVVYPPFANYQLKSFDNAKAFHNMGTGVRKTLDFAELGKKYFILPPISEQHRIADFLDSKCSQIDEAISTKQQQLSTLEEYKKSLIYEYVTGKKEVA